jgi:hypothetical protein
MRSSALEPLTWIPVNSSLGKSIRDAPALDHSQNSHLSYLHMNGYLHRTTMVDGRWSMVEDLGNLPHHGESRQPRTMAVMAIFGRIPRPHQPKPLKKVIVESILAGLY